MAPRQLLQDDGVQRRDTVGRTGFGASAGVMVGLLVWAGVFVVDWAEEYMLMVRLTLGVMVVEHWPNAGQRRNQHAQNRSQTPECPYYNGPVVHPDFSTSSTHRRVHMCRGHQKA